MPLGFGLLHASPTVRQAAVLLFKRIQSFQVRIWRLLAFTNSQSCFQLGRQMFSEMNGFHRLAYNNLVESELSESMQNGHHADRTSIHAQYSPLPL